jgi:hypothetical protein
MNSFQVLDERGTAARGRSSDDRTLLRSLSRKVMFEGSSWRERCGSRLTAFGSQLT